MHEHAPELVRQNSAERKIVRKLTFGEPPDFRDLRSRRRHPAHDVADIKQLAAGEDRVRVSLAGPVPNGGKLLTSSGELATALGRRFLPGRGVSSAMPSPCRGSLTSREIAPVVNPRARAAM
jgi:hypothetical protein